MHHFSPALEYITIAKQQESISQLMQKYKDGLLKRVDYAFELMRLPVDAMSVLLFRQVYNAMKKDEDASCNLLAELTSERKQLRCTANFYSSSIDEIAKLSELPGSDVTKRMTALDLQLYQERWKPSYFKTFWFGMDFRFLPAVEESPIKAMKWDLHRTPIFVAPYAILGIVKSINQVFRQRALVISKTFLEFPEHVRGMMLNRSKKTL